MSVVAYYGRGAIPAIEPEVEWDGADGKMGQYEGYLMP